MNPRHTAQDRDAESPALLAGRSDAIDRRGAEMFSDVAYFTIRADEERSAAMNAPHPIARQKHLELASCYQDMVDAIVEAEREFFGDEVLAA